MKIRYIVVIMFFCSACIRSKAPAVADAVQAEIFTEDSVEYYPIRDNRISVDLNKPREASLFDYFSHIEVIPLETRRDVLIGARSKVIYHIDRYYVLCEQQNAVLVFDDDGMFVYKIDKRGRGPGEYNLLYDIIINPMTGNLDLLDPWGYILSYDLSGNHIKTSDKITDTEIRAIHKLGALDENIYVLISNYHTHKIVYYDIEKMEFLHQEYEENVAMGTIGNVSPFYEYRGQWYFYRTFDNDTYLLGSEFLEKAYTWDFGKDAYDIRKVDFLENLDLMSRVEAAKLRFPYWMSYQGQNNRYVMAQIRLKGIEYVYGNVMYDKSTHESKYIKQFTESVDFRPLIVTNKFVINYCSHGLLEDYLTEEMLDEKNRKIFETYKEIRQELNPVIIKYHFK